MEAFKCDACGLCCRKVGILLNSIGDGKSKIGEAIKAFPYSHTDNVCDMLDQETNKCKVYETRPLLCRVDDMYHHIQYPAPIEKWHSLNYKGCINLKRKNDGSEQRST